METSVETIQAFRSGERDIKVVLSCEFCGKDSNAFASSEDGTWACKPCVEANS